MTPIEKVYVYNQERGLLDQGYDDERECAYPIEEALEGFASVNNPKDFSRNLMQAVMTQVKEPTKDMTDVQRVDKHIDIIVYSLGSLFKLGLNPDQVLEALDIVATANLTKSNKTDEKGKNIKGDDFVPPEEQLQKLLDRTKKSILPS